ncbi:unnamed protein product [Eretmochelys imbricata]
MTACQGVNNTYLEISEFMFLPQHPALCQQTLYKYRDSQPHHFTTPRSSLSLLLFSPDLLRSQLTSSHEDPLPCVCCSPAGLLGHSRLWAEEGLSWSLHRKMWQT